MSRRIIFLFFFLALLPILYSCKKDKEPAVTDKSMIAFPNEYATQMCSTTDSYLAVLTGKEKRLWVRKIDSQLNVLWQKYIVEAMDIYTTFNAASDGGIIMATKVDSSINKVHAFRLDGSGNIVWEKTIYCNNTRTYHIIQSSDGGFFFAGSFDFVSAATDTLGIMYLTANGDSVWFKHLPYLLGGRCDDLFQKSGGMLMVVSSSNLATMDVDGNNLTLYGFDFDIRGHEVMPDGTVYFSGYNYRSSSEKVGITRFDNDGNVMWTKFYNEGSDVLSSETGFLCSAVHSGVILSVRKEKPELLHIDNQGNRITSVELKMNDLVSIVSLKGKCFALGGIWESQNYTMKIWVVNF